MDAWRSIQATIKKRQENVACCSLTHTPQSRRKALNHRLQKTPQKNSLAQMKEKWVLKCVYTHLHALWAQLDSTSVYVVCVLGTAHLCVYPAQWCSLLCRPSGPVAPLPPYQPVSSLSFLLLFLLFQSLSLSLSLWADGWLPGDDKVTVVATAQSLFPSLGIWKVFYLARGIPG